MAEAQELAGLGEKELAQKAMEEFEKGAEELAEKRKEFGKSGEDIGKIERIENNIRNQINIQKGSLGEATPDQEIHKLKVELERIEIEPAKPTSEEPTRTEPIWEAVKEPLKNSTKENSSIRETEKVELNINQLEMEKTYDQKADIGSVFKEIIKEEPVSNY